MSTRRIHPWLETAVPFSKSLGIVVLFSPWLIIIYTIVTRHTATLDPNDREVIRGFIEWFGAAYSFFLALAIVNVWSQFETVEREFDRELDAVSTLHQTLKYTEAANRWKTGQLQAFKVCVRTDIEDYVNHVIDNYKFEHRFAEQRRNGDRILENIRKRISDLASRRVIPDTLIYELFQSLKEATNVRGDRITHSRPYTPVVIQLVAIAASVIWLLSFFGLVIYDEWVATVLIGGVSFVIVMVLVIFFDLGEPFGGIWKIHLGTWREFLWIIDHDDDPQVIFIYELQNTVLGRVRLFTHLDNSQLHRFAHSRVRGDSWKQFWERIQRARPGGHPSIKCLSFYCNQLHDYGLPIKGYDCPLVVLKRGGLYEVILDSQQINSCRDLREFKALFHQKMKEHLPWYEQ